MYSVKTLKRLINKEGKKRQFYKIKFLNYEF